MIVFVAVLAPILFLVLGSFSSARLPSEFALSTLTLQELHQGLERSGHLRDFVGHAAVCGRQHAVWSGRCRKPGVALRAHRHAREKSGSTRACR